jgi:hypothetical protein
MIAGNCYVCVVYYLQQKVDLSEVIPLLQKNIDMHGIVWNYLGGTLKFCSRAQPFRIGTQRMFYYWPIVCTVWRYLF